MNKYRSLFLTILFLLPLAANAECNKDNPSFEKVRNNPKYTIKGPFKVNELESSKLIEIRETKEMKPFGYQNAYWEKMKALHQKGDEIYFTRFRDGRFFQEGHVLVRDKCIIFFLAGAIS